MLALGRILVAPQDELDMSALADARAILFNEKLPAFEPDVIQYIASSPDPTFFQNIAVAGYVSRELIYRYMDMARQAN